jgi:dipeptidyl aminopeptidase/acylaminoacyl peptidase
VLYVSSDGILFAVPFSTKTLQVTGPPIHVFDDVATGTGGAAAFAVARGGLIVLRYGSLTGKRQFVRKTRADGAATPIGPGPGYYRSPRVSPDGHTVAYTLFYGEGPAGPIISPDIWLFDLQSNIPRRLTTDSASANPAWSPDGERIAYTRAVSGQSSDSVMWRPVKTTAPPALLLKDPRMPNQISFGKLHGHIAVSVGDNHGRQRYPLDILLGAADSPGQLTPFAAEAYDEFAARISPDDRLVAYVTGRTGTNEVVVRPVLGNEAEVPVSIGGGGAPVWSRDGHELFYRVPGYLMSAQLSGGAVPAVVRRDTLFRDDFPFSAEDADFDVFPDGKSFVVIQAESLDAAQRLTVLMNWRPGGSNER